MATALPAATDFTGASVTEAQFKTALTNLRAYLNDLLGADGVEATALAALMAPFSAVQAKTAAYSVVAGDRGKVVYYTGSGGVTLTLPVTTTTDMGVGFMVAVKNRSTGTITIARSSTDTIDGATSVSLESGASVILFIAATGAWVRLGYTQERADATITGLSRIRQVVTAAIAANTGTTTIPYDNTSPLSTEGTQIATASITPAASANQVIVRASFMAELHAVSGQVNAGTLVAALFRNSTCIAAQAVNGTYSTGSDFLGDGPRAMMLEAIDSPSTTSATTYTVRIGYASGSTGYTWYVNRGNTYTLNGEPAKTILAIEEIIV